MMGASLTLVTGPAPSAKPSRTGKTVSPASSPAQLWARRKRRQWILGATVAVVLVGAQAYGWLLVLGVI
jgi:hypothetical protein